MHLVKWCLAALGTAALLTSIVLFVRFYTKRDELKNAVVNGDLARATAILKSYPRMINQRFGEHDSGDSLLHLAAANGHRTIVAALINRGAQVNAQTRSGLTPLHEAIIYGRVPCIEELLARGASVNIKGNLDRTPLFLSIRNREIMTLLIKKGADVNARDVLGQTALHLASEDEDLEVVKLLVEHGAEVTAVAKDGSTPAGRARKAVHGEIVRFLDGITANSGNGPTRVK